MQCSGSRGVWAIVHRGKLICGGNRSNVQSMHAVRPGYIIRAFPGNNREDCITKYIYSLYVVLMVSNGYDILLESS